MMFQSFPSCPVQILCLAVLHIQCDSQCENLYSYSVD
uniref:Uncharacterized protein n=1 Tax=Anguilla anguilla TaxID=7936 RepID=A0A0E9WVT3_ANGAN